MDGKHNRDESHSLKLLSETLKRCADDFETVWREALDEQHSAETHEFLKHIIQIQRGLLHDWMRRIPEGHFSSDLVPPEDLAPPGTPAKTVFVRATDREEFPAEPTTIVRQSKAPPVDSETSSAAVDDRVQNVNPDTEHGASFSLHSGAGPLSEADFETWAYTGPPINDVFVPPEVEGYEILEEVGRGGMGVVYRARQRGLNRIVALKMILAGPHASPEQLARFRGEAEAAAQLQHSNIVQVYGVGDQNGLPYFTLEFVDGVSLAKQMRSMPQVPKDASALIEKLARAMDYAHQQGIVHRDLKPANVLLSNDGVLKIADFGLAKQLDGDSTATKTGTVLGTHNYMAPEQGRGDKDVGPPADVYALGSILYEMLTGRPPFLAAKAVDTVMRLLTQEPVPPSRLTENLPRDLETICLKCLQKETHNRYVSARALAEDLRRFQAGEPIQARPVGIWERAWRWCRRTPKVAIPSAAAVLLAMTLLVGGPTAAWVIKQERDYALAAGNQARDDRNKAIDARNDALDSRNTAENERQNAERARDAAKRAQDAAEMAQDAAEAKENQAREAEQRATSSNKVAREQRRLALSTLNTLVNKVQTQLADTPRGYKLKRELIETALAGLRKVHGKSNRRDLLMAIAHQRMGRILEYLGRFEEAKEEYEKFHEIIVEADADGPSLRSRSNVAVSTTALGDVHLLLSNKLEAQSCYQAALELRKSLCKDDSRNRRRSLDLSTAHIKIGRVLPSRDALEHLEKALKLRTGLLATASAATRASRQRDVWIAIQALAESQLKLGQHDDAMHYAQSGLAAAIALKDLDPEKPQFLQTLAAAHVMCGRVRLAVDETDRGRDEFRAAIAILRQLADSDEENLNLQCEYALSLSLLGTHAQAVEVVGKLQKVIPNNHRYLYNVACCYALCAQSATEAIDQQNEYAERALTALGEAIQHGWRDLDYMRHDPDLAFIREKPAFKKLLQE